MKIGIVTTWFERGAGYVSRQYRDLLRDDHEVFVYARAGEVCAKGDPGWDDDSVTWAKPSRIPVLTPIDRDDFIGWMTLRSLDLVIFNEQRWWPPVLWCRQAGVRTCAYVDYYTRETVELFAAYDLLLCNTRRHYEVFSWHPGARYLPWGTDVRRFAPVTLEPVQDGVVTFFHSAGMSPERKGADLVIRAFCQLAGPKRLVIHSQRDLFRLFPDLGDTMKELSERGELAVIGETVPAPGCYHLGDVYVYPSRLDGIGLTVAEALSCGLPAVVPDHPPMSEFVTGACGRKAAVERLYPRYDGYYWPQCEVAVGSLVQEMQWYLDRRPQLPEYKRAARQHAVDRLDWSSNKEALLDMLKDVPPSSADLTEAVNRYELSLAAGKWPLKLYYLWPGMYRIAEALRLTGR